MADYTIISQVQRNKYDPALQLAVEGWDVTARWYSSKAVLTVFVPLDSYNATNVDAAIRRAGYETDQVATLGGGSG